LKEALKQHLQQRGLDLERAHEVLNYVGMGPGRYQKMETYSTGMCQRVKFAQALIHDPKLLLLDEPTSGLDPEGRIEMLELIRELALARGVTILLSSHLLPDIEHVCDHVIPA
jgi:ABC-2 type transport system ATP-binding protein